MKKFVILVGFIAFSVNIKAQSSLIKANPLALAFGAFNAGYEKVLNEKSSFQISANYFSGDFNDVDVKLFGVGIGYRLYITKKEAPRGFYLMPNVSFSSGDETELANGSFLAVGFSATLGYQWIWNSGFVLDLGLGPSYIFISGDNTTVESGIKPIAVMAIGLVF